MWCAKVKNLSLLSYHMIQTLVTLLLLFLSISVHAQDTLKVEDSTLRWNKENWKVYQGKKRMSMDDLFVLMRPYPETFEYIEGARDCKFYRNILQVLSSGSLGYTLGYGLVTNEILWPVFLPSAVLFLASIPLHIRYLNQSKRAVNSYNSRFDSSGIRNQVQFSVHLQPTGVGLR